MARLTAAQAQARKGVGLGTMTRFTKYSAFRELITVLHPTIATTNGQEIRHILLKNDLENSVAVTLGGKIGRLGTFNSQGIVLSTKELIDIVTGDLIRNITQVNSSQVFRVSGDRNVKTIDAEPFLTGHT